MSNRELERYRQQRDIVLSQLQATEAQWLIEMNPGTKILLGKQLEQYDTQLQQLEVHIAQLERKMVEKPPAPSLFAPRKKEPLICPRCLYVLKTPKNTTRDYPCPQCAYVMPIAYIQEFNRAPPLFISLFGWTQQGKSVFLRVLNLHLIQYMYQHWEQYFHRSLTQLDVDVERSIKLDMARGVLPGATQLHERNRNEVYLMHLHNIPRWGSRTSVIMDHAGELFESMNIPTEEIPFLVHTPTTVMLISLPDLMNRDRGQSMYDLLNFYIRAMEVNQVDFSRQRRNLVFVFTKADKLTHLPPNLQHYLATDPILTDKPYLTAQNMPVYLEQMHHVSHAIQQWLEHDPINQQLGGRALLRLIESKNIEARYTLISAFGQDIHRVDGAVSIQPKRVLDPFFWMLEFQSR